MDWLSQNWILLVFAIGMMLLMRRGGMGCAHARDCHTGSAPRDDHQGGNAAVKPAGPTDKAIDPVSGTPVDPQGKIITIYRGTLVYYESRENRERFVATPELFMARPNVVPTEVVPTESRGTDRVAFPS